MTPQLIEATDVDGIQKREETPVTPKSPREDLREALRQLEQLARAELDLQHLIYEHAGSVILFGLGLGFIVGIRTARVKTP